MMNLQCFIFLCICVEFYLSNRSVLCVSVTLVFTHRRFYLAALHALSVCNLRRYDTITVRGAHSNADGIQMNLQGYDEDR